MKMASLSTLRTGGWVESRAIVWTEGFCQCKIRIRNRTPDLPTCNTMPQPTAPLCASPPTGIWANSASYGRRNANGRIFVRFKRIGTNRLILAQLCNGISESWKLVRCFSSFFLMRTDGVTKRREEANRCIFARFCRVQRRRTQRCCTYAVTFASTVHPMVLGLRNLGGFDGGAM